jgi:hypothetical protein
MKEKETDFYNIIYDRVYTRVIMPFVHENKPLMSSLELTEYLIENIDDFLDEKEKKRFVKTQFPVTNSFSDETITKKEVLKVALLLFSVEMLSNLKHDC